MIFEVCLERQACHAKGSGPPEALFIEAYSVESLARDKVTAMRTLAVLAMLFALEVGSRPWIAT